jgi:DNA-binding transcriptional LysR family regulator
MRDLNDLNFFAAVVANGGFSAASRALGAPKSRISRRVAALEAQLGVRLIERSSRRFKVTEVGQDVYRHARAEPRRSRRWRRG